MRVTGFASSLATKFPLIEASPRFRGRSGPVGHTPARTARLRRNRPNDRVPDGGLPGH